MNNAEELYYTYRKKYREAVDDVYFLEKKLEEKNNERNTAENMKDSYRSSKINFEKKIDQIKSIIEVFEKSSELAGILSIPDIIRKFNADIKETDISYSESIKCSGCTAATFTIYKDAEVETDKFLSEALRYFKEELIRLEGAVEELNTEMKKINNYIEILKKDISMYDDRRIDSFKNMINNAYFAREYKRKMY